MNPSQYRYTKEHEWARREDGRAVVGVTHYAQEQLGDIVFVDLPAIGVRVTQFLKFGEIESVKAVSDLFCPVSGEVIETNQAVIDSPELVNAEPYLRGWLIKVALSNPAELDRLMTSEEYDALLAQHGSEP